MVRRRAKRRRAGGPSYEEVKAQIDAREEASKTIGRRIMDRAGQGKDPNWYANELFTELQAYNTTPTIGALCFFSYNASRPDRYPFYDRRPLAYIVDISESRILGANLHYLNPALRGQLAASLINKKQVDFSIGYSKLIHSYLPSNMGDLYSVPVDGNEWNDVAELVTENFVNKSGIFVTPETAWDSI